MALITCKECGAQISEFAEICPSCGVPTSLSKVQAAQEAQKSASLYQQAVNANMQTAQTGSNELPPKSWLVESILVTILCCPPFGIAGIVNAAKVESRWYAGDKAGAQRASQEAGRWTKIGFFCGLVITILYGLLIVVLRINERYSSSYYSF